jgi:hypothetical protein
VNPGRLAPIAWARQRARAWPSVAWRDERIRRLRAENQELAEKLASVVPVDEPSFIRHSYADRRINEHMRDRNIPDRGNLVARKLKAYSFARSHGVRIPRIFGIWDTPEEIDWSLLPDHVVIKSNTGSSGRGVFPLRRVDGGWAVVTTTHPIAPQDVVARLRKRLVRGWIRGPFFAEELLGGGRDNTLPVEVRVSAFYGEVSHALLRHVPDYGDRKTVKFRRIMIDGTVPEGEEAADDLDVPDNLDELVDVARRLSLHIPRPYVRIDLYDVEDEVVFGELTPRPGNPSSVGAGLDRQLGELWELAQARVLNDVIDGGDYRLRFGPGPRELRVGSDGAYVPERGWSDA